MANQKDKDLMTVAHRKELTAYIDGINEFVKDYGKEVSTIDEIVMVFSLEYKLFRPSKVKELTMEMISLGYIDQAGDYIRFSSKILNPRTGKYYLPGNKGGHKSAVQRKSAEKVRPMNRREKSIWQSMRPTRDDYTPMDDYPEIPDEEDFEDEDDYNRFLARGSGHDRRPLSSEKDRLRFWDSLKIQDEPMPDYDDTPEEFLYEGTESVMQKPKPYKRRKAVIRGRGYMMIPDDGTGHVPSSYLETVQSKRTPRSKRMDNGNRSQTVYPNPPRMEDGARWIRHPNRFDIEGIDTPPKEKPFRIQKGSKQTVLMNRKPAKRR